MFNNAILKDNEDNKFCVIAYNCKKYTFEKALEQYYKDELIKTNKEKENIKSLKCFIKPIFYYDENGDKCNGYKFLSDKEKFSIEVYVIGKEEELTYICSECFED